MYICIYQHLYVNCYVFVFFGLHHIIQAGKKLEKKRIIPKTQPREVT